MISIDVYSSAKLVVDGHAPRTQAVSAKGPCLVSIEPARAAGQIRQRRLAIARQRTSTACCCADGSVLTSQPNKGIAASGRQACSMKRLIPYMFGNWHASDAADEHEAVQTVRVFAASMQPRVCAWC